MDQELFIHALETGNADHLSDEEKAEMFPVLLTEYKRLHGWVSACLGDDVARLGGLQVDHGAE